MKTIRTLSASIVLLSVAALSGYAQGTRPAATPATSATPVPNTAPATVAVPVSKIAYLDTEAFGDEKTGIIRFISALQSLQRELRPKTDELQALQAKIQQTAKDIDTLSKAAVADAKTIQAKQEEGARLERELKYKKEDFDATTQRRYREVVSPVSTDIGKELDVFANQHGITMVLDVSKLLPAVLTAKNEMDITSAFIAYYNAKNPATVAPATPRP